MLTQLARNGFLGGFVRDLRGRARDITGADSRVLLFASSQGAAEFSAFVAGAPDPFFGGPSKVKGLTVGGRSGYLIEPPICDCPGAYPVYVGIVADGPRLLWLQLTGPRVSIDDVHHLLEGALSRGD
ncbi:MAG TPA: hypothetical protein VFX15_01775 [Actinomycetes bacterium]|nr:hypothetical protein [Actinomycetes bacterium]